MRLYTSAGIIAGVLTTPDFLHVCFRKQRREHHYDRY